MHREEPVAAVLDDPDGRPGDAEKHRDRLHETLREAVGVPREQALLQVEELLQADDVERRRIGAERRRLESFLLLHGERWM